MVVQTGQPIAQVARDLRVNEGTLGNWVHLWKLDHPDPEPEVTVFDREKMGSPGMSVGSVLASGR